jgi:hypothetical protein
MITWRGSGNLLDCKDHTLLCPINAVGTMGKGLALTMRDHHPGLLDEYLKVYSPQQSSVPKIRDRARILTHVELPTGQVLLFCSKYHWFHPSPLELVVDNLIQLAQRWESLGIKQLAMPLPGTGWGMRDPRVILDKVERHLGVDHPMPVRLYL